MPDYMHPEELSIKEIIELGAIDGQFFTHAFFPRMARQKPPLFHGAMWNKLDSADRMVNLQIFRGGAKTSIARAYTAKRISYGLAKTILYIGKSEGHAIRSVSWLKNQVETNRKWASTFQLSKGDKWQDVEASIHHGIEDYDVWIMAMGITGSIRGINRDDFRPDLIVLDDVIDDENAATKEQREKVKTRIYGAVKESLAPASEEPTAKLAMLQTPIHQEDASVEALSDPEWVSAKFGCWTPETEHLPLHMQESAWPDRWPSEVLRKEKKAAINRNMSSVWYREKECRLISPENMAFKDHWLKKYDRSQLPAYGQRVLVIDPVPPPSAKELEAGLVKKDFECLHVVQRTDKNFYSVDYRIRRGHDPSWTLANTFELLEKYGCTKILVESVAYQRTLAWLIREAMEQRQQWWQVQEFTDARSKFSKIVDSLNGVASAGHLYAYEEGPELFSQFRDYPHVSHDDVLETLAIGVMELKTGYYAAVDFGEEINANGVEVDNSIDYTQFCGAP